MTVKMVMVHQELCFLLFVEEKSAKDWTLQTTMPELSSL